MGMEIQSTMLTLDIPEEEVYTISYIGYRTNEGYNVNVTIEGE